MQRTGFLSDILRRMATAGLRRKPPSDRPIEDLCEELLRDLGEASGLATALDILNHYDGLSDDGKRDFFTHLAQNFGSDEEALGAAVAAWTPGDPVAARALHRASEPRSQGLIRRLNRVPGATARLVAMRADLLSLKRGDPLLESFDADFRDMLGSWFNRGFLELRRIDWSTPAEILEKIIAYEAVHEIDGWEDLRRRVAEDDRRLFAFFHPGLPDEPLIFIEVALTTELAGSIPAILADDRETLDPMSATHAMFYSISNCQKGLRGISFGSFLIKQVASELQAELPGLQTFATLSPVPGLRGWAATDAALLDEATRAALAEETPDTDLIAALTARYLTEARRSSDPGSGALDPVAHFHLGNGAMLLAVHAQGDPGPRGMANSWGAMVSYLYDQDRIEARHQAYQILGKIEADASVQSLARSAPRFAG